MNETRWDGEREPLQCIVVECGDIGTGQESISSIIRSQSSQEESRDLHR